MKPCAFLSCALIAVLSNSTPAAWTQFQGDAAHSGLATGTYNVSAFAQIWQTAVAASPGMAFQGDALYVTRRGGVSPELWKLDSRTGATVWTSPVPNPYDVYAPSAPSVEGDTVYVHRYGHSGSSGSTTPEHKPALLGYSTSTGQRTFMTIHSGQWSSGSQPTIANGAVFAAGGYYGGLDAYELNGNSRWLASVNQQYGWIPAADSQNVYVYMGEASASPGPSVGKLFIVNQSTGARREISHPASTGTRSRTSDDGSVMLDGKGNAYALSYVSGGSTLVSFNIDAGTINWEADGLWGNNPAIAGDVIALPLSSSVRFLDRQTGTALWDWTHTADVQSVMMTDELAFVSTSSGVYAVDLDSHLSVWHTSVTGVLAGDNGVLYIRTGTDIHAFAAVPEPSSLLTLALACTLPRRRR